MPAKAAAFDQDSWFESRGPLHLAYTSGKITKLCCLFICWQHIEKAIQGEERPAPAEAAAQARESRNSHPLSATH